MVVGAALNKHIFGSADDANYDLPWLSKRDSLPCAGRLSVLAGTQTKKSSSP
jgi:hypothetical protein